MRPLVCISLAVLTASWSSPAWAFGKKYQHGAGRQFGGQTAFVSNVAAVSLAPSAVTGFSTWNSNVGLAGFAPAQVNFAAVPTVSNLTWSAAPSFSFVPSANMRLMYAAGDPTFGPDLAARQQNNCQSTADSALVQALNNLNATLATTNTHLAALAKRGVGPSEPAPGGPPAGNPPVPTAPPMPKPGDPTFGPGGGASIQSFPGQARSSRLDDVVRTVQATNAANLQLARQVEGQTAAQHNENQQLFAQTRALLQSK